MNNIKAISVLKTLNKREVREAGDFIFSPAHNKNKNVRSLFELLKPYHPEYSDSKLTKELLYEKMFPGRKFSDKTMRNLLSDMLKVIEEYLAYRKFKDSRYVYQHFRVISTAEKNLNALTESNIRLADRIAEDTKFDGGNLLFYMHLNEMEKDFLNIKRNKLIHLNMKEGEYLVYAFLIKYLIFKMKFFNYKIKFRDEVLSAFMVDFGKCFDENAFIHYLEANNSEHKDLILLYYYSTKFMEDTGNEDHYFRAKELLNAKKDNMSRTEIVNIYLNFNAYCIAKIRLGKTKFNSELLGIYKLMLAENMLIGEGESHMHITIFNNITGLGLAAREIEWTRTFIQQYGKTLMPEYSDTMVNYAFAQYYFAKGEFEKSLDHINKVNFENYYIKSGSRMLLLKIYYELNYNESLLSLCDTLRHYLSHDAQIPIERRDEDLRLVNYVFRLTKFSQSQDNKNLEELSHSVSQDITGTNRDWLLEKIRAAIK